MKVELDEYSQFADRIKCTAKTEDGEGVTPEAGMDNQQTDFSYRERMEAASRAKVIHRMIYGLNQNL